MLRSGLHPKSYGQQGQDAKDVMCVAPSFDILVPYFHHAKSSFKVFFCGDQEIVSVDILDDNHFSTRCIYMESLCFPLDGS